MPNTKKHDLPAMPFYVGDWLKCPEVRSLAPDCRGLWFDLICFMWESTERGVMVKPNGNPYSDAEIVRMVGLDNQNSGDWLKTLIENNVCGRREDGALYSRRMLKDEKIRIMRREVGSKGGNPNLVKCSVNQKVNQNTENENENENEIENKDINKKKWMKPLFSEVIAYFEELGKKYEGEKFFDYFESNGWKVGGKTAMKDWKAAARNWCRNAKVENSHLSKGQQATAKSIRDFIHGKSESSEGSRFNIKCLPSESI